MPEDIKAYEDILVESLGKEIPNIVVYRWILAEWRREARHLLEIGWNPDNKRSIINELLKRKESYLGEIEIEKARGRRAYERYRRTKRREDFLKALSHWGRAGFYSRYLKVIDYLVNWWREELAREIGLEYIGIDADTGRQLFFDTKRKLYVEMDERGRITYESEEIQLDETISVETPDGHDAPLTCEITARTKLRKFEKKILNAIRDGMQTQLDRWLKSQPYYPFPPEGVKRLAPFSDIRSTFNPLKTGVEWRIRVMPETQLYPKALTITERTSRLYPEWRRMPYEEFKALEIDLTLPFERMTGREILERIKEVVLPPEVIKAKKIVKSTIRAEEMEIKVEKKKTLEEI